VSVRQADPRSEHWLALFVLVGAVFLLVIVLWFLT
jgi:LPS O-antigen subunit length determinant protein (WzzB/FepE family)